MCLDEVFGYLCLGRYEGKGVFCENDWKEVMGDEG